jgi:macrodomain Ter protein organizer (MatP/YcbG family)
MKVKQFRATLRLSYEHKQKLEKLSIQNGLSLNQTIADMIDKTEKSEELTEEILGIKTQLANLIDMSSKQTKAILDLIGALKQKGVI